jgi:hypothetical protein
MRQMGGQSCHLDIEFEDGDTWIARLRLTTDPTLPPHGTQEKIFASEVATLRFLSKTTEPVPEVFYASFDDNEIRSPIILMQKLPGHALQWDNTSTLQKIKAMEQLADIFVELHRHPFPSTGSLISADGQVGPFAQVAMFSTPSLSLGPFDKLETALKSMEEHHFKAMIGGELRTLSPDNMLVHFWRWQQIPRIVSDVADDPSFYLKHPDDKGDHILVDDDYNITGIIDWEFISTENKALAFSSPCMMWPIGKLFDGSNDLSGEEIEFAEIFSRCGGEDLAKCVLRGRKHQRLMSYLGSGGVDPADFEILFQGLREAWEGECRESYQEWRSQMREIVDKDDRFCVVM